MPLNLPPDLRRIIILRALYLGDQLIATPALRALRRRFPQAEISLVGLPWTAELLPHIPGLIDRLLPFPGYAGIPEAPYAAERTARFLAEQRAYGYDLAIQMHGDGSRTNELIQAIGARASLGFARPGDTRLTRPLPYRPGQQEVLRWLELVATLGAPLDNTRLALRPPPDAAARAAPLTGPHDGRPLVGLHVGAKDAERRWPAPRFAELGRRLHAACGARILLTGGEAERPLTAAVAAELDGPLVDLTGRTALADFIAVVARLDLLVTNDTGASHVAAALGVPSVVLFGPTRPAQYAPLDGARHRVVDALAHAPAHCDGETALRELPVDPVLRAALEQLAADHRRHAPLAAHEIGA